MNILDKFLKKQKVNEFAELNTEEKDTYRKWEEILSGRKLTDEEVFLFFNAELEDTITKLEPETLNSHNDMFLKVKLQFLRKVISFLKIPEFEKKALEQSISQQIM